MGHKFSFTDPGFGKPGPKVGGLVWISSRIDGRIVKRRVSIRPVFDPNAISMTPIVGWKAPLVVPCAIPDCGLASIFGPLPTHSHPALVAA